MPRQCFHCQQWLADGEEHDCWTTTEAALTSGLTPDLREAYERMRETAVDLGEQRVYASHNSIMFARRHCYFFVRPQRKWLELCIFLGREVDTAPVRKITPTSKTKFAHFVRVTHRDEIEGPLVRWLAEAYVFAGEAKSSPKARAKS